MNVSVVISTRGRPLILKKALDSLSKQTIEKDEFEVIVVEDRPCQRVCRQTSVDLNISYYESSKEGAGPARNIGISKARFPLILFLDDDMIAKEDLLEEHVKYHKRFGSKTVVLGKIENSSEIQQNTFTEYLIKGNLQNTYEGINPEDADFVYFYTGNVSLPKEILLECGCFDEAFFSYGYEDLELGYRLKRKGVVTKYNEFAVGYHYYLRDFESYINRRLFMGKASVIFFKKHPELKDKLSIHPRKLKESLILNKLTERYWRKKIKMWEKNKDTGRLYRFYEFFLNYYYWLGIKEGRR